MKKVYDYYTADKRIILIALDEPYDIPELILCALGNMGVDNLITNPGYTCAFGVNGVKTELSTAPPQIKQSFKKYVIKAIDEP